MTEPSPSRRQKIDELMEKASDALAGTRYFEAERLANKALGMAHHAEDYEQMARILLPLQEARRQRMQRAFDACRQVRVIEEAITEDSKIEPGCYLLRPPLVGADARRLRLAALSQEAPVIAVCREPTDMLGQVPIVALGRGFVVRTKVEPPDDPDDPDLPWMQSSLEELGDWAIDSIDAELEVTRRVNTLMERLEAIPDHEQLHQALKDACREAHNQQKRQRKAATSAP